jgi:hypothetical protein
MNLKKTFFRRTDSFYVLKRQSQEFFHVFFHKTFLLWPLIHNVENFLLVGHDLAKIRKNLNFGCADFAEDIVKLPESFQLLKTCEYMGTSD